MTSRFRCAGPDSGGYRAMIGPALADLTFAVVTINAWNRLAISARTEPGTYRPLGGGAAGIDR